MPVPKKKTTKKTATNKGKAKATPKKAVVKKTAKKKLKKAVKKSKKTVTKKVTKKRSLKGVKKTTKKVNNKSVQVQSDSQPETPPSKETVSLPSSAGPRLQEKVVATHKLMEMLERPMYRIAYVSAFSFILVAALGLLLPLVSSYSAQVASVCVTAVCEDETENNTNAKNITAGSDINNPDLTQIHQVIKQPVLEYFDKIPDTLTNEQQFSLKVTNTNKLDIVVISLETGKDYSVSTDRLSTQNYRYILRPDNLSSGSFKVKAELENDGGLMIVTLGFFDIPDDEVTANKIVETVDAAAENQTDGTTTTSVEDEVNIPKDDFSIQSPSTDTTGEQNNALLVTDEDADVENAQDESVSDNALSLSEEVQPTTEKKFILKEFSTTWQGREVVRVETPAGYNSVQLYIRSQSGLNARFLGTMFKREDAWFYLFESANIPNGDYELFATALSDTGLKYSDSKIIRVANERLLTKAATTTESIIQRTYTPTTSLRNFYEVENSASESEDNSETIERTKEVISNNLESINDLMKRYAVAKQSDNDVLVKAVEDEITTKEQELLRQLAGSPESRDTIAQIDIELGNRIADIKKRVDAFESVRRSRLNDTVSTDSDGDGISDFDERNVYNTDPESADSDGDGFNDGAEVARGYDPTDATAEEIVRYELPTEVAGLERSDALTVAQVNPVITSEENGDDRVFAEISGQGLPNSFVTLYIFSSPIIVTVKTDADGSFVYRFDKELEDGEHEVYVAFTDNRGSILAHSEPFQFVKRAEAFSPVGAETEVQAITAPSVVETSSVNVTRVVLSLTVLVLGFFLMMLGINIRETSPKMKLAENES